MHASPYGARIVGVRNRNGKGRYKREQQRKIEIRKKTACIYRPNKNLDLHDEINEQVAQYL